MSKVPAETAAPLGRVGDAERFQLLVQNITDYAIYLISPEGRVSSWNAGAERLKGYSASEIIGQHYSRFFTEEDRQASVPQRALATARRERKFETEGWRLRKDGTRFWANSVIDTVYAPDGTFIGFAKITRDLSERRAAQQALIDSEQRFRLLVQGVVDYAICMLDPSGIVVNWNAGAERIKGYTAAEIVGRHFSCFYTNRDRTAGLPARLLQQAVRHGHCKAEGWRVRKDGTQFFASVVIDAIRGDDGELLGFAKITRDITEQRQAQEALHESERQFRLLVSGVTDYALYMLDPNGIITTWNAGAERIKGYAAGEIVGQHFSRFYSEAERAAGVPARALATAAQHGRYAAEGWRVRKDGSFFWASVVIDAIYEDDRLVGFAKITRDDSERREAQIALQKVQQQLAESQKMDALGQLTGGVAHDFNNLLMIVSGHIETLKRVAKDHPRAARAADAIEIATKRGAALTRQLLTFSRRQRLSPEAIELASQLEAFRPVLTSGLGRNVRLDIILPADVWPVRVDVSEFEIALVNLMVNARDAMPDGGAVTITAANFVPAPGDPLSGEYVALTIADTGVGIPEDVLGRIFDPFFTTKPVGRGTGLGLSQVHGFAHQAGGAVKVESVVGEGTRMTLCLPRATEATVEREADEPSERPSTGTVLLVEDNPEVASAATGLLEQLGYSVRTVFGADEALLALDANGIDLVFTDVVMPGRLDGLALARAIRDKYPDMPVLLATGYSEAVHNVNSEFPVLRKPYQIGELSQALARLPVRPREPSNLVPFSSKRVRPNGNGK